MANKRIAYILPSFARDDDDWCVPVVRNVIEGMAWDIEPVVYALHYPYRKLTYQWRGITVHCLSQGKQDGWNRLRLWRDLDRQVRADHSHAPFDMIHAFWGTETGYFATGIARRLGIPAIVTLAGGELARFPKQRYGAGLYPWLRYFVARSIARATRLTVGSPWMAARVPARYHHKLDVIPLGVDIKMFAPGPLRQGTRLLAVASVIPLKDYPTLLYALALVRDKLATVHLTIAGYQDTNEVQRISSIIKELHLSDAVEICGEVHHDKIPQLMVEHDLLVHASLYEAQGIAILEALATGMPVVASNVGIAATLPEQLVTCVAPGNHYTLAQAILAAIGDNQRARYAHEHGPELVRREYSVEVMCVRFREIIRWHTRRED